MTACSVDNNQNNGLITKAWGSSAWTFGHCVTYGYPNEPSEDQKKDYQNFFLSFGKVLPCHYCRNSYQKMITEGNTKLSDDVMLNRRSLTEWFYNIHEAVNHKLNMDYGMTLEEVDHKYESLRSQCSKSAPTVSGCMTPLEQKAFSFKNLYSKDCPIIPLELTKPFIRIAKERNISEDFFCFYKLAQKLDGVYNILKKQSCWEYRNKWCEKQIRYMRENGIPQIEESGKWQGFPTIDELKLILFMSSNLNQQELKDIINTKGLIH